MYRLVAEGTRIVMILDTETRRLTRLSDIPAVMCAHSMIYIPGKTASQDDLGAVYVFGGMIS